MRQSSAAMTPPSPDALARVLPFAAYIALLVVESFVPAGAAGQWLYAAQIGLAALLVALFWPRYAELHRPRAARPADWGLAIAVGVVVCVLWINLDFEWARFGEGRGIGATVTETGADAAGVALRLLGAVAVVPVMEELFWRSFLLRWLDKPAFLTVEPAQVSVRSLVICALLFALEHHLWLAGMVAGLAYGWLYTRTRTLWPVVVAHAVTNLLLELWVHRTGSWQFL